MFCRLFVIFGIVIFPTLRFIFIRKILSNKLNLFKCELTFVVPFQNAALSLDIDYLAAYRG